MRVHAYCITTYSNINLLDCRCWLGVHLSPSLAATALRVGVEKRSDCGGSRMARQGEDIDSKKCTNIQVVGSYMHLIHWPYEYPYDLFIQWSSHAPAFHLWTSDLNFPSPVPAKAREVGPSHRKLPIRRASEIGGLVLSTGETQKHKQNFSIEQYELKWGSNLLWIVVVHRR